MSITEALLRPLLNTAPARPLITHYDDAAGTRVELSVATLGNWAAKTANWLADEHDVGPGTDIAVLLPAHWQTAGILLGAWWCGANITTGPARLTFLPPGAPIPPTEVAVIASLDPMGRDLGTPPDGTLDYIAECRIHADDFLPVVPVPDSTPALAGTPVSETLSQARSRATALALTRASRILSTRDWTIPTGLLEAFLTPLAAGASLVHITNPDPATLPSHRTTERTTVDLPT
ncbi:MAG TPA: TIGR03089 family protein [Actinophytocola sp.]|uniref:TIGR03089 family protein n=1 Tax=Actinophytocola sp. TaxID=1872138 RepID=UPI002DBB71A5|nr:TIGR03089 family protein [Actinophytocola sp.]HEU5475835.1 TIGR03089 family protein [Actinophytocola sp.]